MINDTQLKPAPAAAGTDNSEEIKKLLAENQALLLEVHQMTKKIKGYITFQKVLSIVYLVIIVGPIILGLFYLPPLLKGLVGQYSQLLNPGGAGALLKDTSVLSPQK